MLKKFSDAPTYAYGPHGAGKLEEGVAVEEGGDMDFVPDHLVSHGEVISGGDWSVECVYTPGHTSNHICYQLREAKALFSGDHVMGWSTSVISPPDGDMLAYMKSLDLLLEREDDLYWPTHGPAIIDPKTHVRAFIEHRREREQQILTCVGKGVTHIPDMVPLMYTDTPEFLYAAAGRSVLAAVEYLVARGDLAIDSAVSLQAEYRLAQNLPIRDDFAVISVLPAFLCSLLRFFHRQLNHDGHTGTVGKIDRADKTTVVLGNDADNV